MLAKHKKTLMPPLYFFFQLHVRRETITRNYRATRFYSTLICFCLFFSKNKTQQAIPNVTHKQNKTVYNNTFDYRKVSPITAAAAAKNARGFFVSISFFQLRTIPVSVTHYFKKETKKVIHVCSSHHQLLEAVIWGLLLGGCPPLCLQWSGTSPQSLLSFE